MIYPPEADGVDELAQSLVIGGQQVTDGAPVVLEIGHLTRTVSHSR
jgi:hypothetical protein